MHKLSLLLCLLLLSGCASNPEVLQTKNLAEIDSELALLDIKNQDMQNARIHLAEAKSLAPDDPQILVTEGYFDKKAGDFADAEQAYNAAIRAAPDNAQIDNDYGVFLYQQGDYAQALPYFIKAGKNPENAVAGEAFNNAGLAELKLNRMQQAQADFNRALAEGVN